MSLKNLLKIKQNGNCCANFANCRALLGKIEEERRGNISELMFIHFGAKSSLITLKSV